VHRPKLTARRIEHNQVFKINANINNNHSSPLVCCTLSIVQIAVVSQTGGDKNFGQFHQFSSGCSSTLPVDESTIDSSIYHQQQQK